MMARILVVEDEDDIRQVLEYNLRQAGHEVFATGLGRDGLRAALEHRPDLMLLDLMLPDISGTEVCKAMKGSPETRSIPIVVVSAKGHEVDRVLGFELGAEDYVVKPFSVRELLLRVATIIFVAAPPRHRRRRVWSSSESCGSIATRIAFGSPATRSISRPSSSSCS